MKLAADMSKENPIRIMIVDDHFVVRMGLATILNAHPDLTVVAEAANGQQAINLFRQHRPDITLMDLRLPGMGGVEITKAIRSEFPNSRIIVVTTYDGDEDIYRALQAGARAYLLKDVPGDQLVDAIRAVHSGQTRIPPEVASRLAERLPRSELSPREMDVLRLIVDGKSNKEIASALFISESTVKVHVNNILGKMGVSDRTQAAMTAIQRGIVHLD